MSRNLRVWAKHEIARKKGYATAKTGRFDLSLDTSYTPDVGQVLNIRKRLECETWEKDFIDACFQYIGPSETIFEVGTWIGPYSVILSKYVAPQGRLIGFEPDPAAFRQCIINLNINAVSNAFILPLAISDKVGTVELATNRIFGNSGSSIISGNSFGGNSIKVPAVSLDEIAKTLSLEPTTIKMDIEGAEDLALQGGLQTAGKAGVKIMVEVHSELLKLQGKNANTVLKRLADLGKTIYFLENDARYPYKLREQMDPSRPIDLPPFRVIAI
ncbi:MAG: FkbM family methyltransferase [Nitrospirota bacterium]|nr:FkbM family methyltransferase [Nitrospirota bacterium]